MKFKKKNGFTLIELMIVMVLLGILATIGVNSFIVSQKRARDSKRKSDLRQIAVALETYYNDKGAYPNDSAGQIVGCRTSTGGGAYVACPWSVNWTDNWQSAGTLYMPQLPADPKTSFNYFYDATVGVTSSYRLYAKLENDQDTSPEYDPDGYLNTICENGNPDPECTYMITSTNIAN